MADDNKIIKTYSGNKPYAFFSYAHVDSKRVLKIIEHLDERNYRLWYDAGIEAGANWPEVVANHLRDSKTVLLFVSEGFLKSHNCQRELNYAVAEKKELYCIFLEELKLPQDVAMQLSTVKKLEGFQLSEDDIAEKIEEKLGNDYIGDGIEGYEKNEKKDSVTNKWMILSMILFGLLFLTGIGVFGYFNDWFSFAGSTTEMIDTEDGTILEITQFKDKTSRNIMIKAYDGEALYLCGDYMVSLGDAIHYKNGKWIIEGNTVETANFGDLDVIVSKSNIKSLALVNENIEDASKLASMDSLTYLDISGNSLVDISFLSSLKQLETLRIIDIDIVDYSPLKDLDKLKMIYVSKDMYDKVTEIIDPSMVDIVVK